MTPQSIIICPVEPDPTLPECNDPPPEDSCDEEILNELKGELDAAKPLKDAYDSGLASMNAEETRLTTALSGVLEDLETANNALDGHWRDYRNAIAYEIVFGVLTVPACIASIGFGCVAGAAGAIAAATDASIAASDIQSTQNQIARLQQRGRWYTDALERIEDARPNFNSAHAEANADFAEASGNYYGYLHSCIADEAAASSPYRTYARTFPGTYTAGTGV